MKHAKRFLFVLLALLLASCVNEKESPVQPEEKLLEVDVIGFTNEQLIFKKYSWHDFEFKVTTSGSRPEVDFRVLNSGGKVRVTFVELDGTYFAEFKPFSPGNHKIEIIVSNTAGRAIATLPVFIAQPLQDE